MVSLGVVSLILIWILTCTRAVKINSTGSIYQAYTSPSQLWVTTGIATRIYPSRSNFSQYFDSGKIFRGAGDRSSYIYRLIKPRLNPRITKHHIFSITQDGMPLDDPSVRRLWTGCLAAKAKNFTRTCSLLPLRQDFSGSSTYTASLLDYIDRKIIIFWILL